MLAATSYRIDFGRFPANTDHLVVAVRKYVGNVEESPVWRGWIDSDGRFVDEWGRPLKLTLEDDGQTITIYSLGMDGVDDGGERGRDESGKFHDDIAEFETIGKN